MKLTQEQANRLRYLMRELKEANDNTVKFDAEWNVLNDAFNQKIALENQRRDRAGRPRHSPSSIAEQKSHWLSLSEAFAAGQWWRGKALWLSHIILAEKAAMEMLYGGAGWEPIQRSE